MPKAPPTPQFPLNGLFPIAKPSGPASMRIIDAINPLLLESRLFEDPNDPGSRNRQPERNKRKKNTTHQGLKIGQGGTLDPLADGVLVIGVNRGTKHLNRFLECSKEYESIGILGAATTSYDSEGSLLSTGNFDGITREDVERVLDRFRGKIKQTPPIFSALKMDGKPLYEYARESKPLPRPIPVRECTVSIDLIDFKPAEVVPGDGGHNYRWPEKRLTSEEKEVFSKLNKMVADAGGEGAEVAAEEEVDLSAPDMPEVSAKTGLRPACFTVRMTVSSGTYVRSIVHDIGLALGCGAHVVKLTRTRQGEFVLHGDEEQLAAIEDIKAAAAIAATPKRDRKPEVKQEPGSVIPMSEEDMMNDAAAATPTPDPKPEVKQEPDVMMNDAAAAPAPTASAEEAAANESAPAAASSSSSLHPALAHPAGPTTGCIPWSIFEKAIAERNAEIEQDKLAEEENAPTMTPAELRKNFGAAARIARARAGELKEWEIELLRRFVPVPMPVVHDSKSRGAPSWKHRRRE